MPTTTCHTFRKSQRVPAATAANTASTEISFNPLPFQNRYMILRWLPNISIRFTP